MPANAGMFNSIITSLAVYEVFEIGDYANEFLELEPTDPVNEKYESIGFGDLYFTNNVGCYIFTILFAGFLVAIWLLLYPLSRWSFKTIEKIRGHIAQELYWNKVSSLIFESFLNVVLCSLIALKHNFATDEYGQRI